MFFVEFWLIMKIDFLGRIMYFHYRILKFEELNLQSIRSIFTQKYLHKCKDAYSILQNKYLLIFAITKIFLEQKYFPKQIKKPDPSLVLST